MERVETSRGGGNSKPLPPAQLRRNLWSGLFAAAGSALAVFAGYPLYLTALGAEVYGVWLVLAAAMQFAVLGDFGVSQATLSIVAREHSYANKLGVQRCIGASALLVVLVGSAMVLVLCMLRGALVNTFDLPGEYCQMAVSHLPWVGVVTVGVVLGRVFGAGLSGIGRMDAANYLQVFGAWASVATSATLLARGNGLAALIAGVAVNGAILAFGSVAAFGWFAGHSPLCCEPPRSSCIREVLRFGGGLLSASLIQFSINPINKFLLCRFCGLASVPIYEIACSSVKQVKHLADGSLRALVPEIGGLASASAVDFEQRVNRINRRFIRAVIVIATPAYLAALILIKPLLTLWIGGEIAEPLTPVMFVTLLGSLIGMLGTPAYYILLGAGRLRSIVNASVVNLTSNLVASTVLVIVLGSVTPLAMAFVLLVSVIATTVFLLTEFRRVAKGHHRRVEGGVILSPS